jgi:hypothetical protein
MSSRTSRPDEAFIQCDHAVDVAVEREAFGSPARGRGRRFISWH